MELWRVPKFGEGEKNSKFENFDFGGGGIWKSLMLMRTVSCDGQRDDELGDKRQEEVTAGSVGKWGELTASMISNPYISYLRDIK